MKTVSGNWFVPAGFFLIAAMVNLVARALGAGDVASMVKPALLPLIAVTTIAAAGGLESRTIRLLVVAQLLGCAGDIFLIANGMLAFGCGIACFLAGHIFYFMVFGSRSWKGMKPWTWVLAIAIMAVAAALLLLSIGVKGTLLWPIAIYAMALMFLIFSGLAGLLRKTGNPATWTIVLCGAVLFAGSDSMIAIQIFGEKSTLLEFLVMFTYLVAQCLLAIGALRLNKSL